MATSAAATLARIVATLPSHWMSTAPGWYPDPTGVAELRWYDGSIWTDSVATGGTTFTSPLRAPAAPVETDWVGRAVTPERIATQVQRGGGGSSAGSGDLFSEPVLVVNQKAKLIEITNEYAVYDAAGQRLGSVTQVGQSAARKALRVLTNVDQFLTHRLEVRDAVGNPVLALTRPAKIMKSTVLVNRPDGSEIGRLVQENMIGKIRFAMVVGEHRYGSINAENWRAWNFSIRDHTETEIARITKTWEGLGKAMFTTADNYVVRIHAPLEDPLRSLVVAAAVTVDTALKQDEK